MGLLKDVAERFNALESEGNMLLRGKKDPAGQTEKLKERARLLVDLPNHLAGALEGVDQATRQRILRDVSNFAIEAQGALESGEPFTLMALLNPRGSKIGDKNNLERLVESLESK